MDCVFLCYRGVVKVCCGSCFGLLCGPLRHGLCVFVLQRYFDL